MLKQFRFPTIILVVRVLSISECSQVKKSQTQRNELYQAPIYNRLIEYAQILTNPIFLSFPLTKVFFVDVSKIT